MAAKDLWADMQLEPGGIGGIGSPARASATPTYSDSVDLTYVTRALYIGAAGDVKVTMLDGSTPTFKGVAAGTLFPFRVSRVWATNTTVAAGAIVAVW